MTIILGSDLAGRLTTPLQAEQFMLAGNATLTLRSVATGARYTFKVQKPDNFHEASPIWFVKILTGDDNENDYTYVGQFKRGKGTYHYEHGKRSSIDRLAPSVRAVAWWTRHLFERDSLHPDVEVWHEGRCGRCGRKLTVPESVESGFGPECIQHIGG